MKNVRLATMFAVIAATLVASRSISAFKPNADGHLGITESALRAIVRTINSEALTFSERAIVQIQDANKATDSLSNQGIAELHVDDESFSGATARLVNLKASIIAKITASSPDGAAARKDLGTALHTLQDFYAHSNWVELANLSFDPRLGRSTFAGLPLTTATCPSDAGVLGGAGLTSLTSGWFKIPLCVPPAGKCRHGIPLACSSGLNKDDSGRTGFSTAKLLAVEASIDYLKQIVDSPGVSLNAKATKALMDIRSTLGVIIDDTGSMGGIISSVKVQVGQIVASVRGTADEPAQYLLVRFGDPDVGNAVTTADPDVFLGAVNTLSAGGGGDCPELSMAGTLRAVAASQEDASLYLFTDASAKDASLISNVITAAQAKRIQVTPLLFGSCSPIDPAYQRLALETGGQLFVLNPAEAGNTFSLIRPQLTSGHLVPVLTVKDSLAGARQFAIPVDTTSRSLTVGVSMDVKGSITLIRPGGAAVSAADATITDLSSGRVFTVDAPEPGEWQLQLSGSGAFSIEAHVNSPIDLQLFDFVELAGREAHQSYFPLSGQPLQGTPATGLARLLGPYKSASFSFVSESGGLLQTLDLTSNEDAGPREFVGAVALPAVPFRVVATGLDQSSVPFYRTFSTLFRTQTVSVRALLPPPQIPTGTTTVSFEVTNVGANETFRITAIDNLGLVTRVQPQVLTINTGTTGRVDVDVTVPAGVPDGQRIQLTVTASSTTDAGISNGTTVEIITVANRAPIVSTAEPSVSMLWPPNHQLVPVGVLGVTDPDGDPVSITIDRILQNEPTDGDGDGSRCPDALGIGTSQAQLRAERAGNARDRTYLIFFTATDSKGASVPGSVGVCVPHDRSASCTAAPVATIDATVCSSGKP